MSPDRVRAGIAAIEEDLDLIAELLQVIKDRARELAEQTDEEEKEEEGDDGARL